MELLRFIEEEDLMDAVDPIQLGIRLLVPLNELRRQPCAPWKVGGMLLRLRCCPNETACHGSRSRGFVEPNLGRTSLVLWKKILSRLVRWCNRETSNHGVRKNGNLE